MQTLVAGGFEIADERLLLVSRRAGDEPRHSSMSAASKRSIRARSSGADSRVGAAAPVRPWSSGRRLALQPSLRRSSPDGGRHLIGPTRAGASGGDSQVDPDTLTDARAQRCCFASCFGAGRARRAARVRAAVCAARLPSAHARPPAGAGTTMTTDASIALFRPDAVRREEGRLRRHDRLRRRLREAHRARR